MTAGPMLVEQFRAGVAVDLLHQRFIADAFDLRGVECVEGGIALGARSRPLRVQPCLRPQRLGIGERGVTFSTDGLRVLP